MSIDLSVELNFALNSLHLVSEKLVCVRFSHQDDYTESEDYVVDPDSADTAAVNETTSSTVENSTAANDIECKYIDRSITIAENSTAFLTCTPNDPNYTEVSPH